MDSREEVLELNKNIVDTLKPLLNIFIEEGCTKSWHSNTGMHISMLSIFCCDRKSDFTCTSCVMRIRFGLAYSPLWERSIRITRAYHDVILWINSDALKILACDRETTCCHCILHRPTCSLLFLCVLFFANTKIIMSRNVIDDSEEAVQSLRNTQHSMTLH